MKLNIQKTEQLIAEHQLQLCELAELAGISRQGIYRVLRCGQCRLATIGKLASALDVGVDELMNGGNGDAR